MSNILVAKDIYKKYNDADGYVLDNVNLSLKKGEIVSLIGSSGSGKSTLLHILGLLDFPTSGDVIFHGINTKLLNKPQTICKYFGFVYQTNNLLQEFSAEENIMLPQLINGVKKKNALERARYLLSIFQMSDKCKSLPGQLSGGQKQRVAIARAIANTPEILLADEPTGSLDNRTSEIVMDELLKVLKEFKISAIIATHSDYVANRLDRQIKL